MQDMIRRTSAGASTDLAEELQLVCQHFTNAKNVDASIRAYQNLGPTADARHTADAGTQNQTLLAYCQATRLLLQSHEKIKKLRAGRGEEESGPGSDPLTGLKSIGFEFLDPSSDAMRDGCESMVADVAAIVHRVQRDLQAVTRGFETGSWRADLEDDCSIKDLCKAAADTIGTIESDVLEQHLTYVKQVLGLGFRVRHSDIQKLND